MTETQKERLMQKAVEREGREENVNPCGENPFTVHNDKPVFWYNNDKGTTKVVMLEN